MELKEKKLTKEEVINKRNQLEDFRLSLEVMEIQLVNDRKLLDLNMPERRLKSQIRETEKQIELTKGNIQVIEQQVKTGREKYL